MSVYKKDNDKRNTSKLSNKTEQKKFLNKLVENNFNILKTCKETDIPISTVYYKMNHDKEFHDKVKGNKDFMKTMVKNKVMELLMSDNQQTVLSALDKLSKSDLLNRLMDEVDTEKNINLNINKDDITFGGDK